MTHLRSVRACSIHCTITMQSLVVLLVALAATASAQHLRLVPHPATSWVTNAPEAVDIKYTGAGPATTADEAAWARAVVAASAGSPLTSAYGPGDAAPVATPTWVHALRADERARVAALAGSRYVNDAPTDAAAAAVVRAMAAGSAASAFGPDAAALGYPAPAGRLVKVCDGGACKIIDAAFPTAADLRDLTHVARAAAAAAAADAGAATAAAADAVAAANAAADAAAAVGAK